MLPLVPGRQVQVLKNSTIMLAPLLSVLALPPCKPGHPPPCPGLPHITPGCLPHTPNQTDLFCPGDAAFNMTCALPAQMSARIFA